MTTTAFAATEIAATIEANRFTIWCTGDVCTGDTILFTEAVFVGGYRRPHYTGNRRTAARVIGASYGAAKRQHTFRLEVLLSDGTEPAARGAVISRKGRNVYRNGTLRQAWPDEAMRVAALADKHARRTAAREARLFGAVG